MSTLFVEDKNIKVSRSSFSIFENEIIKYEGRLNKIKMADLTILLLRNPSIMDALAYEMLNIIYNLSFCTSRQLTEYINIKKNTEISQSQICKKLDKLNKLSIITRYSFSSEIAPDGTNMKVYSLDYNGKILLQSRDYHCEWKHTDNLYTDFIKSYLIRNQYLIKLLSEKHNINNIQIKNLSEKKNIGLTYTIKKDNKDINHIIIPIRKTTNFNETLIKTFDDMKTNSSIQTLINKKIIIIGEDVQHLFEIYKTLYSNDLINDKIYFLSDLRLFNKKLKDTLVKFEIEISPETKKPKVVLTEQISEEF